MFGSQSSPGFATTISASRVGRGPVIASNGPRGPGDPRVNIQNDKGKAKPYQVRQIIEAIEKLEGME